jgi:3-methyladenine DNA glycosylase AlkD
MHTYLKPLEKYFKSKANPERAEKMSQYMRNQFKYWGIMSPIRKELESQFISEYGLPDIKDMKKITKELWALPQREYQYTALLILSRTKRNWKEDMIPLFEYLIKTKSWWDTVDGIAPSLSGYYFQKYGGAKEITGKWIESNNFWFRRSALIFQLKYRDKTDEKLLFSYIKKCNHEDEFFIRKAIGWALREHAKRNPESVRKFVANTQLKPLSIKEALKHIEK